MLDDLSQETAALRLQRASTDAALSASAREHARQLADRLTLGVKIIVLGPSGIGKTTLCDAIFGRCGSEEPISLPTSDGIASNSDMPLGVYQADPAVFGNARVIDLAAPKNAPDFEKSVQDAIATADIVIWCTQEFDAAEASMWERAPDPLKDHSFLVLTKADLLAEKRILRERIKALQPVVSEEFHSFFPVTTSRIRQLQKSGEPVSDAVLAASGIKALIETVSSLVQSGQRADLDSAILFLERQGLALDDPLPIAAAPEKMLASPSALRPIQQFCKAQRDRLIERAFDIAELGFDESEGDMSGVMDMCVSISEDLTDNMQKMSKAHPELSPWNTEFEAASDKIMLMTMENDTRSAADAVIILLQLRRDLEQLSFQ